MISDNQQPILTIVGPTGVGKTAIAVELANDFDGELVSADSRQIYSGMDIATGKEVRLGRWETWQSRKILIINGVPIHGLDVIEPDVSFSVYDWQSHILPVISDVIARGKRPIVVGGTGFYLQALQGKIDALVVGSNQKLRDELSALPALELQARLRSADIERWKMMNDSDRQNPMRLVRAIEVAEAGKLKVKEQRSDAVSYDLKMIGLTMERNLLYAKVDARIDRMFEEGLVEETRQLLAKYDRQISSMTGIGYAEAAAYLAGDILLSEAIQKVKWRTHAYIRRQYTWFRKQEVQWLDTGRAGWRKSLSTILNVD